MFATGKRFFQWLALKPNDRSAIWKFYGQFTGLAFLGCVFGAVSAGIQASDEDGVLALLYYFSDERVFLDPAFSQYSDLKKRRILFTKFAAICIFDAVEFFCFNLAKILAVHRLTFFMKHALSDRVNKIVGCIAVYILGVVFVLSLGTVLASTAAFYYYSTAGQIVADSVATNPLIGNSTSLIAQLNSILDDGNNATSVVHVFMCCTVFVCFLTILVSGLVSLQGIRLNFSLDKLNQSTEANKVRLQIHVFIFSVSFAYMLDIMCVLLASIMFHVRLVTISPDLSRL
jgi:hypothetical protein